MIHTSNAISSISMQTDLKKLLRNPPLAKIPKISDMISVHPLMGALPSSVREPLQSSTKEIMKLRGVTLYREGSKPNGIWLISNGVVKVISNLFGYIYIFFLRDNVTNKREFLAVDE